MLNVLANLQLKIRRGETPVFRLIRGVLKGILRLNVPVPRLLHPVLCFLYELHFLGVAVFRRALVVLYREPLFRSRCTSVGRHLRLDSELPFVLGHADIRIGDNVTFTGGLNIISGRFLENPKLIIMDRAVIGGDTTISVNREVVIEDDVMISTHCRIADNDGHPREADLRAAYAPLEERDIRAVRICKHAWIGNGSQILKGVTVGEGAIVGANSVVVTDIPEYCVAMGNPARVLVRNVGRPRGSTASSGSEC